MKKILSILKDNWVTQALTSPDFVKRLKGLLWSSGTMLLAGSLDLIVQQLSEVNPDNIFTICVGLIFAQITKQLNVKTIKKNK